MILKDYEKLPEKMKNEKVKEYYDIISKKKISLVMKRIFDIFFSLVFINNTFTNFINISNINKDRLKRTSIL